MIQRKMLERGKLINKILTIKVFEAQPLPHLEDLKDFPIQLDHSGFPIKVDHSGFLIEVDHSGFLIIVDLNGFLIKVNLNGFLIKVDHSDFLIQVDPRDFPKTLNWLVILCPWQCLITLGPQGLVLGGFQTILQEGQGERPGFRTTTILGPPVGFPIKAVLPISLAHHRISQVQALLTNPSL